MSAAWPPGVFWDIPAVALAMVLFREVYNDVLDVAGVAAAWGEVEAFVVNRWMAWVAAVDGGVEYVCSSVFLVLIAWISMVVMFVFRRDGSGIEDSAWTTGFPALGVVVPCTGFPSFCAYRFPSFSFLGLSERI